MFPRHRMRAARALLMAAAICIPLVPAAAGESAAPAPRQSRPVQLAQACRTLCVEEFNACQRSCDTGPTRIDCQARCQTRLNLCTSSCR